MPHVNIKKLQNMTPKKRRIRLPASAFKTEYTTPAGIARVRVLHPTKGYRDSRA